MIECIFTVDCEIYGNGHGSLKELVYEPAKRLVEIFAKRNIRFVAFVEVAELEMIETHGTDPGIELVRRQVKQMHEDGFEIGLHFHPQWYNGHRANRKWVLDYSEYNLSALARERIIEIVDRSISYLRELLDVTDFVPLSFRAGNWLFQPTKAAAQVLAEAGIRVDSSVFKGGLQRQHKLDYRPALKNGHYWKFTEDVNVPDSEGAMLELPIHTQMVPTWTIFTTKRIGLQRKGSAACTNEKVRLSRLMDFIRFRHPLKFDFCRMTIDELTRVVDTAIRKDRESPMRFWPLVAIGHTKDLTDFESVSFLLHYLDRNGIPVSTFSDVYPRCMS